MKEGTIISCSLWGCGGKEIRVVRGQTCTRAGVSRMEGGEVCSEGQREKEKRKKIRRGQLIICFYV